MNDDARMANVKRPTVHSSFVISRPPRLGGPTSLVISAGLVRQLRNLWRNRAGYLTSAAATLASRSRGLGTRDWGFGARVLAVLCLPTIIH